MYADFWLLNSSPTNHGELLAEVNCRAAAVEQTEGDFSQYLRKPVQKIQFDKNENFTVTDEAFEPHKTIDNRTGKRRY